MNFAVLCSGQGAQHPAMLDMIAGHPAAIAIIQAGEAELGMSLHDALAHGDTMYRNSVAQPLLCLTQLALWTALRPASPAPLAFCGYSVGELGAYACAGAMGATELARIASARAALMDQTAVTKSGLLAVQGLPRAELDQVCTCHQTWIAIAISDEEFIIGGEDNALEELGKVLVARGAKLTRLKVGLASHTPLLGDAVEPFRVLLDSSTISAPVTRVVAGIDAAWVAHRAAMIEKLALQLSHTIEWASCLDTLYERGCRVFLELGPGRALARMTQARYADVQARAVDDFRSLDGVAAWLSKHAGSR